MKDAHDRAKDRPTISVVIPCHNEEAVLPQVYTRVAAAASTWGLSHEVILIDDGSMDGTWQRIKGFHQRDARWKGVRLTRNFGHQAAIGAGLFAARGKAVVVLDADLQDPPELIKEFIQHWQSGCPIVHGVRAERPEGWHKRVCYASFYWLLTKTTAVPMPRDAGDFCLMDRKVVETLKCFDEAHPFWRGLRSWTGYPQMGVPYTRHSRQGGEPQYSLGKLMKLASDGFWSVSHAPLMLVKGLAWIGLAATTVLLWSLPNAAATSLGIYWLLTVLGITQIFGLSLVGRHLSRIHDEVRGRPRWLIASTIGLKPRRCDPRSHVPDLSLEKTQLIDLSASK